MMNEKESRISAAGVVQSVIASGAPMNEWEGRARYGLNLVNYLAKLMRKEKAKRPPVPAEKEKA